MDYLCRHMSQSTTVCWGEGADSANPLLLVPPNFFTFRHPCFVESSSKIASIQNVEKIRPRNVGKSRRTYIIMSVHSSHKVFISRQKFVTFTYGRRLESRLNKSVVDVIGSIVKNTWSTLTSY